MSSEQFSYSNGVSALLISLACLVIEGSHFLTTKDQILVTCIVWVAGSLQTTSSWAHGVFLSSLISTILPHQERRWLWRLSEVPRLLITCFISSLGIATWMAFLSQVVFQNFTLDVLQILVFLATASSGTAYWWWKEFPKIRGGANGLDFVQSASDKSNMEQDWYEWEPPQVCYWLEHECLVDIDNANDPTSRATWISAMTRERIQGRYLPKLSVEDWRSLGLPLGVALHVRSEVDDLLHRYPIPGKKSSESEDDYSPRMRNDHHQEYPRPVEVPTSYQRDTSTERVQLQSVSMMEQPEVLAPSPPQQRTAAAAAAPPALEKTLPPEILAKMPPHIADIIRRNPELLQKAMKVAPPAATTSLKAPPAAAATLKPPPASAPRVRRSPYDKKPRPASGPISLSAVHEEEDESEGSADNEQQQADEKADLLSSY